MGETRDQSGIDIVGAASRAAFEDACATLGLDPETAVFLLADGSDLAPLSAHADRARAGEPVAVHGYEILSPLACAALRAILGYTVVHAMDAGFRL